MSKQDRQGVRSAADLERKWNFGQTFAEIMGIATDAQKSAKKTADELAQKLTHEEIFNLLTNNGAIQGIYRDPDTDEIYINAEYISSYVFTTTAEVFLEPQREELDTIHKHILNISTIPDDKIHLYDFDNDGDIDVMDMTAVNLSILGIMPLKDWSGAIKSKVTLTIDLTNPEKTILIKGTNMWGREIEAYWGVNYTNVKNPETSVDYIVSSGTDGDWKYEKWASGKAVCWGNFSQAITANQVWSNNPLLYYGEGTVIAYPTALFVDTPVCTITKSSYGDLTIDTIRESGGMAFTPKIAVVMVAQRTVNSTYSYYAIGRWK